MKSNKTVEQGRYVQCTCLLLPLATPFVEHVLHAPGAQNPRESTVHGGFNGTQSKLNVLCLQLSKQGADDPEKPMLSVEIRVEECRKKTMAF